MEENFSMEWKIFSMEWKWKKIVSMEYGKIIFHSIPYHVLFLVTHYLKRSAYLYADIIRQSIVEV